MSRFNINGTDKITIQLYIFSYDIYLKKLKLYYYKFRNNFFRHFQTQ